MSVAVDRELARRAVNTIKFLAVDAVEQASSGHPGMPMGAADMAFVLWSRFLRYDPKHPDWADRDRFVLSAGHGSMLLYALLHLSGFGLSLDELRSFRQWESKTPGHPEFGHTVGVESTTGPLGQGVGNAVGMALAARMLAARLDGDEFQPVTHRVFALASDGDLMEGISGEASSFAGHLGLGNLVVLYDDNHISIEGDTALTYSEDVGLRYEAYGWHVQRVDGHDHEAIAGAIDVAIGETSRPSIVCARTHIAHGAPNAQDTADSHGAPLGAEEVAATKRAHGWPLEPTFHVPDEVKVFFKSRAEEGAALRTAWEQKLAAWTERNPEQASLREAILSREAPEGITARLLEDAPTEAGATRGHSGAVLQRAAELIPGLVGGSADLGPSNKTTIKGSASVGADDFSGRNLHFGVREHAMGAILNGFLYHGSFRPYGGTFLIFSDYMRPAIRLAGLAGLPAIYVLTHDSIFLGEDGPTHQAVEQASALRLIPNLRVFRPADGFETALCWGLALEHTTGPSALLLTRQKVPPLERSARGELADPRRGGYLVAGERKPDAIVVATGSEVHMAMAARRALAEEGKRVHVVSVPCLELLQQQDPVYRARLFPAGVPVASVEAGRTGLWRGLTGATGLNIGVDRFGASAPSGVMGEKYGLTDEAVTAAVRDWLAG
jgi:transketolase